MFHSDSATHRTTNEFQLMNEADAKTFVKLAKANGRFKHPEEIVDVDSEVNELDGQVQLMEFDEATANLVQC